MIYKLKNEYYDISISDMGAEIVSIKSPKGFEFLWQGGEGLWSMQAPVLFPLCGSYANRRYTILGEERPIELHGFALTSEFELAEKTNSSIEFVLRANEKTKLTFPFEFELFIRYTLNGDTITLDAKVRNLSDITMPYMFGWHPGFNLPTAEGQDTEDYEIDLKCDELSWTPMSDDGVFYTERPVDYNLCNSAYRLNTKEIYPNDTMIFKGHKNYARMFSKGHPYELTLTWSENLPTLCLWKEPIDETKFICIEPWSDYNTDGVNDANFDKRKVEHLLAGGEASYFFNLKITE
jgi:galactose mutarotase-like enzyme